MAGVSICSDFGAQENKPSEIKPAPLAGKAQSLNHWTERKVPIHKYFDLTDLVCSLGLGIFQSLRAF